MSNANGSKWIRPEKRLAVYARDGFCCVYCGATESEAMLSLDHVLPREMGGTHHETNLVTSCVPCNSAKRDISMRAWFVMLRDRGVNTAKLSAKIRAHVVRPLDMKLGKQLRANRRA